MRKTKKSKILSFVLCMSMIISTFAFMPQTAAAEVKDLSELSVKEQFEYLKLLDSDEDVEKAIKSLSDEEYEDLESYAAKKAQEEAENNPSETVNFTEAGPLLPAVNTAKQTKKKLMRAKSASVNTASLAADDAAADSESEDGLNLSKTVTENADGTYKITLEAYTTGKVKTTSKTTPVDIVLVLDQSGSMAYDFNGNSTSNDTERRQYAMKQAVNNFINEVNKKYSEEADHRVSIVTFGKSAETLIDWTSVDAAGKSALSDKVDGLPQSPTGATNVGAGMQTAEKLMGNGYSYTGKNTTRQKVVIVFTDGVPTTSSDFSTDVANNAISSSKNLKDAGCTVYSIGIFNGADPDQLFGEKWAYLVYNDITCTGEVGTFWGGSWASGLFNGNDFDSIDVAAGNRFLNYLSSNYSSADQIGVTRGSYNPGKHWGGNGTGYKITKNYNRTTDNNYYLTAGDSESLKNIFTTISEQIQTSDIDLGSETVIKDIVANQFTMPDGADKISVKSIACTGYNNGEPQWSNAGTAITDGVSIDTENKSVNVTGFNFNNNFVSKDVKSDGTYGSKIVIEFNISVKDGFLGGNDVKTNGAKSGIYENTKSQTAVKKFEQPTIDIPIKDIKVTAADKNIYLQGSLTKEQLQSSITAETSDGKISLDFTQENYGLESWQTEYINISHTLKNGQTDIGNEGLKNLTTDADYTLNLLIEPKTEGSSAAENKSAAANINVFKPELTFKDSTVYYGTAAPTSYAGNKQGEVIWKHGNTKSTNDGVTMTGTEPELNISYTPAAYDKDADSNSDCYKGGAISTKQDIPVNAAVKIDDSDVTEYVAFKHTDCDSDCSYDKDKEQFLIHVKTCSLTVTKTGGVDGEPYVMNIYKKDKNGTFALYTSMTIVGNASETVYELPAGTYSVQEDTNWAWRYKAPVISDAVALGNGSPAGDITVTNQNRDAYYLNSYSTVVKNVLSLNK